LVDFVDEAPNMNIGIGRRIIWQAVEENEAGTLTSDFVVAASHDAAAVQVGWDRAVLETELSP
jgi:hypothetical protein